MRSAGAGQISKNNPTKVNLLEAKVSQGTVKTFRFLSLISSDIKLVYDGTQIFAMFLKNKHCSNSSMATSVESFKMQKVSINDNNSTRSETTFISGRYLAFLFAVSIH